MLVVGVGAGTSWETLGPDRRRFNVALVLQRVESAIGSQKPDNEHV
jgi:hypothetical protein